MKYILSLFLVILIGCNENGSKKNVKSISNQDTIELINKIQNELSSTNTKIHSYAKLSPVPIEVLDSFSLHLYCSGHIAKKLEAIFQDDENKVTRYDIYFLNDCIVEARYNTENDTITTVYLGSHKSFNYFKQKKTDSTWTFNTPNQEDQYLVEAYFGRELDEYMSYFPSAKHVDINPSEKAGPTLQSIQEASLRDQPFKSSKSIAKIAQNESLIYLGSNQRIDTVENRVWIWYKVETPDNKTGWVFGHPDLIRELNDGD